MARRLMIYLVASIPHTGGSSIKLTQEQLRFHRQPIPQVNDPCNTNQFLKMSPMWLMTALSLCQDKKTLFFFFAGHICLSLTNRNTISYGAIYSGACVLIKADTSAVHLHQVSYSSANILLTGHSCGEIIWFNYLPAFLLYGVLPWQVKWDALHTQAIKQETDDGKALTSQMPRCLGSTL